MSKTTALFNSIASLFRKLSLKNLRLAHKFGVVLLVLIAGFGALGMAYYQVTIVNSQASSDLEAINEFGDLSDRINIQFLEMRRLEKDFIINHDESLLEEHALALATVENLIAELLENPPTEETAELVEEMSLYLMLYQGGFSEMADTMITAGLDAESGQRGQLTDSSNAIADILLDYDELGLSNSLLRLRELEKLVVVEPLPEYSDAVLAEQSNFESLLASSELSLDDRETAQEQVAFFADTFIALADNERRYMSERETFSEIALEFAPILTTMRDTKNALQTASQESASADQRKISTIFVGIVLGVGAFVSLTFFSMSRIIRRPLQQALDLSIAISEGRLQNEVQIESSDETGELLQALENMQTQLRDQKLQLQKQSEEDRKRAEESKRLADESKRMAEEQAIVATENGRIKQALDGVSSAVLMLNADLEIIYHNEAAHQMFRDGQQDIRKTLPGFSPEGLVGKGFECLYANATDEGRLLNNLTSSSTSEKELGDRTYKITVSPVLDKEGNRIGTVAEWTDRTAELAIEEEVQAMVGAAKEGNLGQRIELSDKSGFYHSLSEGVNDLVGVAEQVINDTVVVLHALAKGDLTQTIDGDFKGVFAKLKSDVNTTVEKLTEVVRNIQTGAGSVDRTAREIAESNAEVSSRTENQAAVLEETASAMEEMTATVKQTANNTAEANKLANDARTQAEAGGEIVGEAITAMSHINDSGNQISNIISVIDEISFQTNLLALNAAVEAARAGEQGKGFAVVADEVRQLAANSANAAKEIKELIDHSNQQINRGTDLVNKSGEALKAIVESVKQVTTINSEIAAASQEQAQGIDHVNQSITNMDEGTQQNAAMVEQVTGASNMLEDEAHKLNLMMNFFTLKNDEFVSGGRLSPNGYDGATSGDITRH